MSDTLVRMPKLADTLVEGTLGQWLKQVGDEVRQGEPLASIETDKVTTEISAPETGTVLEHLVAEGQTVPIETPIARIGTAATPVTSPPSIAAPPAAPPAAAGPRPAAGTPGLVGSGPADHWPPTTGHRPPPGSDRRVLVPLTPMRRAIADHMTSAFKTIPHGQTVIAADLTRLVAWRERHKLAFQQNEGANLTFTVLFVHALARQLAARNMGPVDLGVAVALDGGLIVPVLRAADALSLGTTAQRIADLASRARSNTLTPEDVQGALMTVTNVGSFGNLTASPIVPLTQMGILGPGLVERRPMPGPDNGVRLGWRCLLSLMFDRRALDDFAADRLLRGIVDELERMLFAGPREEGGG